MVKTDKSVIVATLPEGVKSTNVFGCSDGELPSKIAEIEFEAAEHTNNTFLKNKPTTIRGAHGPKRCK